MQLLKNKFIKSICYVGCGIGAMATVATIYNNLVIRNISISEPLGFYLKLPIHQITKGNKYLVCVDKAEYISIMHRLGLPKTANQCPYLSPYIIKQVVGLPGDWVTANESGIFINGAYQINTKPILEHNGINLKPLPLNYKHKLEDDEYFVLGITRTSYDSRYFGVIKNNQFHNRVFMFMNNQ